MRDEEEDIVPNEDGSQDDSGNDTPQEHTEEGFDDVIRPASGSHFYENNENPEDTITKVTGMYKDWFLDYATSYYALHERVGRRSLQQSGEYRRTYHAVPSARGCQYWGCHRANRSKRLAHRYARKLGEYPHR